MFEVVIDNKTYLHPSKIEEVNLDQWIALNSEKEDELKAFSAFSGIPYKQLLASPKKDVQEHLNRLSILLKKSAELVENDPPDSIKIGASTYYVEKDMDGASMAQYLDCTHYMRLFTGNQSEFYPYMMAIYCLRKGEKYNNDKYDIQKRAKVMRKAQAVDAIKINAFFLHGSKDYEVNFTAYFQANQHKNS